MRRSKIIGLTGGIASGKSTASKYIVSKGYFLIDADQVARDIVEPGQVALKEIVEYFGNAIVDEEGRLRRKALGQIVFSEPEKLARLNGITHPRINERILKLITDNFDKDILFDSPLLFEGNSEKIVDKTILIYLPLDIQLERVMKRDNISKERALQIINAQMPLDEKVKRADYVVSNEGSIEDLYHKLDEVLDLIEDSK